jgi:hypothetical protein
MSCSFSASREPSRLAGRLSSQARYSSCKAINVATAAAQRCGRGSGRRCGAGGNGQSTRSRARRRAWRCAGVIGRAPMRGLGIDLTLMGKRDCHVCQLKRRRSVGWPTGQPASRRALRAPAPSAAAALTRADRPASAQPCRRHLLPTALGGCGAQAAVLRACFQGCPSRSMALRVTSILRIRATVAVLAVLPAAMRRR